MATKGKRYQALRDFLEDSFSRFEFDEFLKFNDYEEIASAVVREVSYRQYCLEVVEAMERQGYIDAVFFDLLKEKLPRKVKEIEDLKSAWLSDDRNVVVFPGGRDTNVVMLQKGNIHSTGDTPRCAICGHESTRVLPIDGDPSNRTTNNLLRLCPDCFPSLDQLVSTKKINPAKFDMYRRYKEPKILTRQFDPLFARMQFLESIDASGEGPPDLSDRVNELTAYVRSLEKGDFYSDKLLQLTREPVFRGGPLWEHPHEAELQRFEEHHRDYGRQLLAARHEITDTIVELLVHQDWPLR